MEFPQEADQSRLTVPVFALALALMSAAVYGAYRLQQAYRIHEANLQTAEWPEKPRLLARLMIERYGPPDRLASGTLVWYGRAPWKRVIVHEDQHRGPLEEVVSYDVDSRAPESMRAFGRGVSADAIDSELSARSDQEQRNFLALNLADEILTGAKTPDEAARFYDKTVQLAASGKSSGYTAALLFETEKPAPEVLVKDMQY